jgi:transcriptional regulator with XRE-family HTH domain
MAYSSKKEVLGRRIKALRKQAHLNQETVAERIGIDTKSLSRIECGTHYPSLETLEAISEVIQRPLMDFFNFPEEQETEEEMREYLSSVTNTLEPKQLQQIVSFVRDVIRKAS